MRFLGQGAEYHNRNACTQKNLSLFNGRFFCVDLRESNAYLIGGYVILVGSVDKDSEWGWLVMIGRRKHID